MPAVVGDEVALPQFPHHRDRLLEHLQAFVARTATVAGDVLVERFAGADTEDEPALEQHCAVAAAWAMMAGWIRWIGQVTAVVTGSVHDLAQRADDAQTNGLWPWASFHGW